MALLKYLKPVDGLPDPKGSLTAAMSSAAIAEAMSVFFHSYCVPIVFVSRFPLAYERFSNNSPPDRLIDMVATYTQISPVFVLHVCYSAKCERARDGLKFRRV